MLQIKSTPRNQTKYQSGYRSAYIMPAYTRASSLKDLRPHQLKPLLDMLDVRERYKNFVSHIKKRNGKYLFTPDEIDGLTYQYMGPAGSPTKAIFNRWMYDNPCLSDVIQILYRCKYIYEVEHIIKNILREENITHPYLPSSSDDDSDEATMQHLSCHHNHQNQPTQHDETRSHLAHHKPSKNPEDRKNERRPIQRTENTCVKEFEGMDRTMLKHPVNNVDIHQGSDNDTKQYNMTLTKKHTNSAMSNSYTTAGLHNVSSLTSNDIRCITPDASYTDPTLSGQSLSTYSFKPATGNSDLVYPSNPPHSNQRTSIYVNQTPTESENVEHPYSNELPAVVPTEVENDSILKQNQVYHIYNNNMPTQGESGLLHYNVLPEINTLLLDNRNNCSPQVSDCFDPFQFSQNSEIRNTTDQSVSPKICSQCGKSIGTIPADGESILILPSYAPTVTSIVTSCRCDDNSVNSRSVPDYDSKESDSRSQSQPSERSDSSEAGIWSTDDTTESESQPQQDPPVEFNYSDLASWTNNFKEGSEQEGGTLIGRGGFANVYLGKTPGGLRAIKRINIKNTDSLKEEAQITQFNHEVMALSSFSHKNLLIMYGYSCTRADEDVRYLCIVYEYMLNGSLEDKLACKDNCHPLSLNERLGIIKGTAEGISFLHQHKLVHRDIKSANILLSADLTPKIGDFGLARQQSYEDTRSFFETCTITGTRGYMPPEYLEGTISDKMDAYAFGVVILETLTGRPGIEYNTPNKYTTLKKHVQKNCESDHAIMNLVDRKCEPPWLQETAIPLYSIAKKLLLNNRKERSSVLEVLEELYALKN